MNQEPCYDGENSTKNHLMGIFPAAGKNLHAARSVALVLRDHAGDRQLAKQSRCFDSAAVAGYAAAAYHLYLDEQGRLLCLQLPAGHVLYRHPAGSGAREQRRRRLRRLRWLRGHEPGGQLLADREGYSAHHRRRDPEGQQYPEHYRHSVNRYRDPRGGDRRNYRLAAA